MKRYRYSWIYLIVTVVGISIACTLSDLAPLLDDTVATPVPLPDSFIGENVALVENSWRLVEITHNGEVIAFEAIAPIIFFFTSAGYFGFQGTNCNSVGFKVITKSGQRYRLTPQISTAMSCGELGNAQSSAVSKAFLATTAYEISGNQLLLTGNNVQIILEIDEVSPFSPKSPVATPAQPLP